MRFLYHGFLPNGAMSSLSPCGDQIARLEKSPLVRRRPSLPSFRMMRVPVSVAYAMNFPSGDQDGSPS